MFSSIFATSISRSIAFRQIFGNKNFLVRNFAEVSPVSPSQDASAVVEQQSSNSKPIRTLFVGNIPYNVGEMEMIRLFSEVGAVETFRKPPSRGFGFCEFKDSTSAAKAIEKFNGFEYKGRKLIVNEPVFARKKRERLEKI